MGESKRKGVIKFRSVNVTKLQQSGKPNVILDHAEIFFLINEQVARDYENAAEIVAERMGIKNESLFTHKNPNDGQWSLVIMPCFARFIMNVGMEVAKIQFERLYPVLNKSN